jgi:hypothetical protein
MCIYSKAAGSRDILRCHWCDSDMYLIQTMHLSVSLLFLLLSYSLRYSPLWEWSTIEAFLIYRFLLWRFRFSYLFTRILANLSDRAQAVTKCWNGRYTISTISVGRYTHLNISAELCYICMYVHFVYMYRISSAPSPFHFCTFRFFARVFAGSLFPVLLFSIYPVVLFISFLPFESHLSGFLPACY